MNIGEKLLNLRKKKNLSQEEVAEKLNVSRQTVSKWETDQSIPDFDKIAPLCELYDVSADYLLTGKENKSDDIEKNSKDLDEIKKKKAQGISLSVLIYFLSVIWIMTTIPVFGMNPIISVAIFLIICGIATSIIIYTCMVYKKDKTKEEEENSKLIKQINEILSLTILIIYLAVSFITMAWRITWLLWIFYGLLEEIVKLVFMIRGKKNEE